GAATPSRSRSATWSSRCACRVTNLARSACPSRPAPRTGPSASSRRRALVATADQSLDEGGTMRGVKLVLLLAAAVAAPAASAEQSSELAAPVPVLAAGKPIDVVESGHATPFVVDFDGDGKLD